MTKTFLTLCVVLFILTICGCKSTDFITYATTYHYCEYRLADDIKIIRREIFEKDKILEQYFIETDGKLYVLVANSNRESNLFFVDDKKVTAVQSYVISESEIKKLFDEFPRKWKFLPLPTEEDNQAYKFKDDKKYKQYR
ncbi:MAG: hypothetical protein JW849_00160 [Phycisphaerae bacterium]|nr:hypothetical protein [Phycisphaerae bacterium]